jgi:hypothetical protein
MKQTDGTGVWVKMQIKAKVAGKKFSPALAKGQRWQTKDAYIEII